jgi:hypothetical protein
MNLSRAFVVLDWLPRTKSASHTVTRSFWVSAASTVTGTANEPESVLLAVISDGCKDLARAGIHCRGGHDWIAKQVQEGILHLCSVRTQARSVSPRAVSDCTTRLPYKTEASISVGHEDLR